MRQRAFACIAAVLITATVSSSQNRKQAACSLLSPGAIQEALGEAPKSTKPTTQIVGEVLFSNCFYELPTFTNSVSVAVTAPGPADVHHDAAAHLWGKWFHGKNADEDDDREQKSASTRAIRQESEKEEPATKPEPVSGVGDEAFWIRSFVGNLYVRQGEQFFRISIGGKLTPEQRLEKAKLLAADALKRLKQS